MRWRSLGSIDQYYNDIYYEARKEIGELSENAILEMDADETAVSYQDRFALPILIKDPKRPIRTEKISTVYVVNDDGDLLLRRGEFVRVSYPIKPSSRIEEVIQRCARVEDVSLAYGAKYVEGYMLFDVSETDVTRAIAQLEENMQRRNAEVQSFNGSIKGWLMKYINDLKKALEQELSERRSESPSKKKNTTANGDDDWDDDDSDHERTPNDDRSDTLNPNNPAYDDARDNRADQLNPNNPEYRGH